VTPGSTLCNVLAAQLKSEIEALLAEGKAEALKRECSAFVGEGGSNGVPIVLFGAGNLGRLTLRKLRSVGIEPAAFTDSRPDLWESEVDQLKVLSPGQAASLHGAAGAFVVTIWTGHAHDRMRHRVESLRALGCRHVMPFTALFWHFSETFLPHYAVDLPHKVHDAREDVLTACELWSDSSSRREYLGQVRWRLLGDFDALSDPVEHLIYFPSDVCKLTPGEVFIDCGAFDGDTVRSFLEQGHGASAEIYAFEPDPINFAKLQHTAGDFAGSASVTVRNVAVGSAAGKLAFRACGSDASYVCDSEGDISVDSVTLDEALAGMSPTYIKMDIEGFEVEALLGASQLIKRCSPVLAVCSYHRQNHPWKIPLLIRSMNPEYSFFLRPHLAEGWDLVCYAIPKHRLSKESGIDCP